MCMNLFRQYYEWLGTEQANGNPTHSFAAEKALMQFLAHQKLVNWCHSEDVRGPTHPQTLATLTHTHTHTRIAGAQCTGPRKLRKPCTPPARLTRHCETEASLRCSREHISPVGAREVG